MNTPKEGKGFILTPHDRGATMTQERLMYVSTIPSGCCVKRGMVQVRFGCFLDVDDHDYETHHVYIKVSEDPEVWEWVDNPFHNVFCYFDPDVDDEDILKEGDKWCKAAYKRWKDDEPIILDHDKVKWIENPTQERIDACEALVAHLQTPLSSQVEE